MLKLMCGNFFHRATCAALYLLQQSLDLPLDWDGLKYPSETIGWHWNQAQIGSFSDRPHIYAELIGDGGSVPRSRFIVCEGRPEKIVQEAFDLLSNKEDPDWAHLSPWNVGATAGLRESLGDPGLLKEAKELIFQV